jgi:NAD(P)-dependent dehydrogenase (short-subunit alcohol dehydrogenase family)
MTKEQHMQLKDKIAIVTGGASGFGKAIAASFIAQGARVMVADLNSAGAQAVADALGGSAMAIAR